MNSDLYLLGGLSLVVVVVNLPFGYLRAGVPKLSWRWFLYIHLPVPFVIALRWAAGLSAWTIPWLIALAILGQFLGGKVAGRSPGQPQPVPDVRRGGQAASTQPPSPSAGERQKGDVP
jgi:cytochrome b561